MPVYLAHPPIPLLEIRVADLWLLLGIGAMWELLTRCVAVVLKTKSAREVKLSQELYQLNYLTAKSRSKGMSAFVETSKLERQVLQTERDLAKLVEARKDSTNRFASFLYKSGIGLYVIIFLVYFGIPLFKIDGAMVTSPFQSSFVLSEDFIDFSKTEEDRALGYLQGFLFPISYIGTGMRLARSGLPKAGMGALVALWSSQVTVGKVMDGIEAYFLT